MRALVLIAIAIALAAGCSTSSTQSDGGVSFPEDAASGPQPVGAPCDPALASPCLPTGDDCLGVYCDPTARICTQYVTDAGPPCSAGATPCTSSSGCDVGLTCGFPIGGGCGGEAQGICIDVALSCEDDAAACSGGGTACGCGGGSVSVVIAGYATGPSPSGASVGGPCPADSGVPPENSDAGGSSDGGDGGSAP